MREPLQALPFNKVNKTSSVLRRQNTNTRKIAINLKNELKIQHKQMIIGYEMKRNNLLKNESMVEARYLTHNNLQYKGRNGT